MTLFNYIYFNSFKTIIVFLTKYNNISVGIGIIDFSEWNSFSTRKIWHTFSNQLIRIQINFLTNVSFIIDFNQQQFPSSSSLFVFNSNFKLFATQRIGFTKRKCIFVVFQILYIFWKVPWRLHSFLVNNYFKIKKLLNELIILQKGPKEIEYCIIKSKAFKYFIK
jgi:hypothetical protein